SGACTKTWIGPSNGAFAAGANWSPAGAPSSSDVVCASAGTSIVSTSDATIGALYLSGSLALSGGTLTISGSTDSSVADLTIAGGFQAGDLWIADSLSMTGGGGFSGSGTTTLAPAAVGTATLSAPATLANPHVLFNYGTFTFAAGSTAGLSIGGAPGPTASW